MGRAQPQWADGDAVALVPPPTTETCIGTRVNLGAIEGIKRNIEFIKTVEGCLVLTPCHWHQLNLLLLWRHGSFLHPRFLTPHPTPGVSGVFTHTNQRERVRLTNVELKYTLDEKRIAKLTRRWRPQRAPKIKTSTSELTRCRMRRNCPQITNLFLFLLGPKKKKKSLHSITVCVRVCVCVCVCACLYPSVRVYVCVRLWVKVMLWCVCLGVGSAQGRASCGSWAFSVPTASFTAW